MLIVNVKIYSKSFKMQNDTTVNMFTIEYTKDNESKRLFLGRLFVMN